MSPPNPRNTKSWTRRLNVRLTEEKTRHQAGKSTQSRSAKQESKPEQIWKNTVYTSQTNTEQQHLNHAKRPQSEARQRLDKARQAKYNQIYSHYKKAQTKINWKAESTTPVTRKQKPTTKPAEKPKHQRKPNPTTRNHLLIEAGKSAKARYISPKPRKPPNNQYQPHQSKSNRRLKQLSRPPRKSNKAKDNPANAEKANPNS